MSMAMGWSALGSFRSALQGFGHDSQGAAAWAHPNGNLGTMNHGTMTTLQDQTTHSKVFNEYQWCHLDGGSFVWISDLNYQHTTNTFGDWQSWRSQSSQAVARLKSSNPEASRHICRNCSACKMLGPASLARYHTTGGSHKIDSNLCLPMCHHL